MLAASASSFAFTTQGNWRWRKNDGTQITATWFAAQNTPIVLADTTQVLRLRVELYNDPNNSGGTLGDAFFEVSSDSIRWDTIKVVSDPGVPFKLIGSSPNLVDKEPTTQQLTNPNTPNFQTGKVIIASNKLPSSTVGDNTGTEYEWAIKATPNILLGTKYYFRVDAANYVTGRAFPTLTTAAVLPINLSAFSVSNEGSKVKLQWSTESEQNNDRFEVQRSANGRTWETISTVKGKGTFSSTSNYSAYDNNPLKGTNYYRLQQYDINGRAVSSDVKSVKFGTIRTLVTVSPNPARGSINFKLDNESAKSVLATLSDANGKIIYQQTFKDVRANTLNKLNLQQPTAGIYILQLKGDGLAESIKVVVQ